MQLYAIYEINSPVRGPFFSMAQAEAYMNSEMKEYAGHGMYWRVKVILDHWKIKEVYWKDRERLRFDRGEYEHTVWAREQESFTRRDVYRDHYVHVSLENPEMIAYTPDAKYGEADRQVIMKPGRYLKKYFSELGNDRIEELVHWFTTGELPNPLKSSKVEITNDPDKVQWVYEHGPQSCMSGTDWRCHPARVYATEDMGVAYALDPHNPERVIARAVVCLKNKTYGRVYPTPDNYQHDGWSSAGHSRLIMNTFADMLGDLDYTDDDGSDFHGMKLRKEKFKSDSRGNHYIMPYIDGDYGVETEAEWDYFRIATCDSSDSNAKSTGGSIRVNGSVRMVEEYNCPCCGEECDEDETTPVVTEVSSSGTAVWDSDRWCPDCVDQSTFYCEILHRTVADSIGYCHLGDGRTVNQPYADEYCFMSEYDDEYYECGEFVEVMDNGQVRNWTREQFRRHGFTCPVMSLDPDHRTHGRYAGNGDNVSTIYTMFDGRKATISTDVDEILEEDFVATMTKFGLINGEITYVCDDKTADHYVLEASEAA